MLPWDLHLEYVEELRPSSEVTRSRFSPRKTPGPSNIFSYTVFSIKDTRDYRTLRSTGIREKFVENFIGVATAPFVATGAVAVAAAVPG